MYDKKRVGRPLKFPSVEGLQKQIDEYFKECDKLNKDKITKPYTITGLAVYLDTDRQTLINYTDKEQYFDTIKRAKERILQFQEENAMIGNTNTVFSIFSLKNNYGWCDKVEVTNTEDKKRIFDFLGNKNDE